MVSLVCSHAAWLSDLKRPNLLQPQTNPLPMWLWFLNSPTFSQAGSMGRVWGPIPPPEPRTPATSRCCLILGSLAKGLCGLGLQPFGVAPPALLTWCPITPQSKHETPQLDLTQSSGCTECPHVPGVGLEPTAEQTGHGPCPPTPVLSTRGGRATVLKS